MAHLNDASANEMFHLGGMPPHPLLDGRAELVLRLGYWPVTKGFCDMSFSDRVVLIDVGYRSRDLQHTVITPRGKR